MKLTYVTLGTGFDGATRRVELHMDEDAEGTQLVMICGSKKFDKWESLRGFDVFFDVDFPKDPKFFYTNTHDVFLPKTCKVKLLFRLDGDFLRHNKWQRMLLEYWNIVAVD